MALTYVQLGSWNIIRLGSQPTESGKAQSVYALTDHIEMAGVDVLALQEIYVTNSPGPGQPRRNEHLDWACKLLHEHTGQDWKYEILENRRKTDKSQLCAVMWNDSMLELGEVHPIPVKFKSGVDRLWDRRPHAVTFTTREKILGKERTFVLVPLHMKANTGGRSRQRRTKEAEELAKNIPWVLEETKDESLILAGDTNILGSWERAADHLIDAGFEDLNAEDGPTFVAEDGAPFDRFYVRKNRPEFRFSRQYVLRSASHDAHRKYLSDHYMIKTSIKIYVDEGRPEED